MIQLQNNNQPYFHLVFFFSFLFLIGTRLLYQDYLARRIKSLGQGLHMLTRPCLCLVPIGSQCFLVVFRPVFSWEVSGEIGFCCAELTLISQKKPCSRRRSGMIWDWDHEGLTRSNRKVTIAAFHGKLSLLLAWTDAEARQLLWKYPVANTDHWDHFCVIF